MDLQFIKYDKRDHIAYITINRREVMNALNPQCHQELRAVWDDFAADNNLWIAIVSGAGERAFSTGHDLKYSAANPGPIQLPYGGWGGITARFDINKPLIAAVNGVAFGGGFELALACDIVIAAEHARFALPEPRVGLIAGAGGTYRLPRQLPVKIAMSLMLTGRQITAREALELGVVNEVVPFKDLLATAERWAAEIIECAPISVRATKEAAYKGLDMPLEEAMNTRFPLTEKLLASPDLVEGPRAFAEKRKPNWRGE